MYLLGTYPASMPVLQVSAVGQSCPQAYTFAVPATSAQSYRLRLALIAANVPSVLLPTNVPGVTRQAQPDSGSGKRISAYMLCIFEIGLLHWPRDRRSSCCFLSCKHNTGWCIIVYIHVYILVDACGHGFESHF